MNKVLLVVFLFTANSYAQKKSDSGGRLKTDISFDDLLIKGKYNTLRQGVSTTEEDKVLDGLIGIPTDFNERLKMSEKDK